MHQAALGRSRRFDSRAGQESGEGQTHGVAAGVTLDCGAGLGKPRRVTWRDVRLILPTLTILLFTALVVTTVIPHAFSSVLRQLEAVRRLEAAAALARVTSVSPGPALQQDNTSSTTLAEL